MHICNPSPQQAEAEDQEFKVIPQLHKEFKASMGYRKPSLSLSPSFLPPFPAPFASLLPPCRPGQPSQAATTTWLSLRFCLFWMLAINGIAEYTAALCHRFSHLGTKIPQRNEDNLKGVCVSHSGYLKQSSLESRDFPSGFTSWEKKKAEACCQSNRKYGSTKREVISSGAKTDQ